MTRDIDDPMEAEFDTVAEWTALVAADLGPEYYIPAACRGSGQPAVLDWLLERLGPRSGEVMIDVGAGLGGPAAYAAHRTGVQPILAEPEPDACRAAAWLFGAPVLRADATALPPPDWAQRVEVVERELHRRYGHRPELTTADEQSRRIGHLLSSGQPTSQVILLRCAPPEPQADDAPLLPAAPEAG